MTGHLGFPVTDVSAVKSGHAPDIWTALNNKICDYGYKLDFGRLFQFAGGLKSDVGRAVLFGSRPPRNDSLWASAEAKGFEVIVHDRNVKNREKMIDTAIVTEMVSDSFEHMNPKKDEITLVAGDSDYIPTIESLRKRGFVVDVVFWDHASTELKRAASKFVSLNKHLDHLRLT